jgi:hypothetical protein
MYCTVKPKHIFLGVIMVSQSPLPKAAAETKFSTIHVFWPKGKAFAVIETTELQLGDLLGQIEGILE